MSRWGSLGGDEERILDTGCSDSHLDAHSEKSISVKSSYSVLSQNDTSLKLSHHLDDSLIKTSPHGIDLIMSPVRSRRRSAPCRGQVFGLHMLSREFLLIQGPCREEFNEMFDGWRRFAMSCSPDSEKTRICTNELRIKFAQAFTCSWKLILRPSLFLPACFKIIRDTDIIRRLAFGTADKMVGAIAYCFLKSFVTEKYQWLSEDCKRKDETGGNVR